MRSPRCTSSPTYTRPLRPQDRVSRPPEEFESFDHSLKEEIRRSLEELQGKLSGLYAKRQFKVRYHTELKSGTFQETYAVLVFTLKGMDALVSGLGYEAAQKALRSMGSFIDGHFSAVGGFSARLGLDEFVTVLPYSDMKEAEAILKGFADDFQERGSRDILSGSWRKSLRR